MKRLVTCILVTCATSPAQEPWTADEAGAAAFQAGTQQQHQAALGRQRRRGRAPVFVPTDFSRNIFLMELRDKLASDKAYRIEVARVTTPDGQGNHLTYLLPTQLSGRAFVSDMQGRVLFATSNGVTYKAGDSAMPGNNLKADGLTVKATIGRDGRKWQPLTAAPMTKKTVSVVDEHGKAFDELLLTVGPAAWFEKEDAGLIVPVTEFALPAAMAASIKGKAELNGVITGGLFLGVRHPVAIAKRTSHLLKGVKITRANNQVVVSVPRAPLRAMQCKLNENMAHRTLRVLSSGQSQCMASGVIDGDGDDRGEFGFLAELAGASTVRAASPLGEVKLSPSVMPTRYGELRHGCMTNSGYLIQVFLPGKKGWVAEGAAAPMPVDADQAEKVWRCYAWPLNAGETGNRAFFVDQTGTVYVSDNRDKRYSGFGKRPKPDAAVSAQGMDTTVAANGAGVDGQKWLPFVRDPIVGEKR